MNQDQNENMLPKEITSLLNQNQMNQVQSIMEGKEISEEDKKELSNYVISGINNLRFGPKSLSNLDYIHICNIFSLPLGEEVHIALIKYFSYHKEKIDEQNIERLINSYKSKKWSDEFIRNIIEISNFDAREKIFEKCSITNIVQISICALGSTTEKGQKIYQKKIEMRIVSEFEKIYSGKGVKDGKIDTEIISEILKLAELMPIEKLNKWKENIGSDIREIEDNGTKFPKEFEGDFIKNFGTKKILPLAEPIPISSEFYASINIWNSSGCVIVFSTISEEHKSVLLSLLNLPKMTDAFRSYLKETYSEAIKEKVEKAIAEKPNQSQISDAVNAFVEDIINNKIIDERTEEQLFWAATIGGNAVCSKILDFFEGRKINKDSKVQIIRICLSTDSMEIFERGIKLLDTEDKLILLMIVPKQESLKSEKQEILENWLVNEIKNTKDPLEIHDQIDRLTKNESLEELLKYFFDKKDIFLVVKILQKQNSGEELLDKLLDNEGVVGIENFIWNSIPKKSAFETKASTSFTQSYVVSIDHEFKVSNKILIKAIGKCNDTNLLDKIDRTETSVDVKNAAFARLMEIAPEHPKLKKEIKIRKIIDPKPKLIS